MQAYDRNEEIAHREDEIEKVRKLDREKESKWKYNINKEIIIDVYVRNMRIQTKSRYGYTFSSNSNVTSCQFKSIEEEDWNCRVAEANQNIMI